MDIEKSVAALRMDCVSNNYVYNCYESLKDYRMGMFSMT